MCAFNLTSLFASLITYRKAQYEMEGVEKLSQEREKKRHFIYFSSLRTAYCGLFWGLQHLYQIMTMRQDNTLWSLGSWLHQQCCLNSMLSGVCVYVFRPLVWPLNEAVTIWNIISPHTNRTRLAWWDHNVACAQLFSMHNTWTSGPLEQRLFN